MAAHHLNNVLYSLLTWLMAIQKTTRFRQDMTEKGRPTINSAASNAFTGRRMISSMLQQLLLPPATCKS